TGGRRQHFLAKSTNRGVTFSAPRPITPVFNEVAFGSTYRVNSFLSLAVDQSRPGTVYGVYADQPSGAVGAEVEFITSSNGAATFIGDYAGVAASGGFAHPVWTSGGFNNGILQTTTLPLP